MSSRILLLSCQRIVLRISCKSTEILDSSIIDKVVAVACVLVMLLLLLVLLLLLLQCAAVT